MLCLYRLGARLRPSRRRQLFCNQGSWGNFGLHRFQLQLGLLASGNLVQDAAHHAVLVVGEADFNELADRAVGPNGHPTVVQDLNLGDIPLTPRPLSDNKTNAGAVFAFAGVEALYDGMRHR